MNDVFFTFRSVTAAMRGSRLLADQSIRSLTVRTPKLLQEQGCRLDQATPEQLERAWQSVKTAEQHA